MTARRRLRITGIVQGVGFRPFIWRLARRHGLSGWVENDAEGVTIEVEGEPQSIAEFSAAIGRERPPLAVIEAMHQQPLSPLGVEEGFAILASGRHGDPIAEGHATLPPDIATCPACAAEVADATARRHRYPFTNCTDCGPRYTIITALPYDRPRTTMDRFAMCEACRSEYTDPADRRFHAQPIACPDCGPVVWLAAADEAGGLTIERPAAGRLGETAIADARSRLLAGGILAIKGLGGFHLACDATNPQAVARLRARKGRGSKPLAVMADSLATARRLAAISEQEARLLTDPAAAIVLLKMPHGEGGPHGEGLVVAELAAAGNGFLGVMLPYTPLHAMLCEGLPPLVMTSGNLSEEPIARENREAVTRLAGLADAFLLHDRPIHVACDDSVVRCVAGTAMPVRRSRGFAPLPIRLADDGPAVLAVGGELKATLCLARGREAILSQHIGDLGSPESLEALSGTAEHLMKLFGIAPERVAADLHPGYLSTGWAREFATTRGIPLVQLQHHEAHAASLLAEHGLGISAGAVVVACFDGTGYARDGTIAGGEFFVVERGRARLAARLAPFPLPGGDAAIRHPWRTALAVASAAGIMPAADRGRLWPGGPPAGPRELAVVHRQLASGFNCLPTTSMGRLFDAVASITGLCHHAHYEAEPAMRLEAAASGNPAGSGKLRYAFSLPEAADKKSTSTHPAGTHAGASDAVFSLGWQQLIDTMTRDAAAGEPPEAIAAAFHQAVADGIAAVAVRLAAGCAAEAVGLTGGVFQNARLTELTIARLDQAGLAVLTHHRVPPNDGGLSLGQAVLARR